MYILICMLLKFLSILVLTVIFVKHYASLIPVSKCINEINTIYKWPMTCVVDF